MEASMIELERLLDAADAGELGVPDFQREFVWSDTQVISLLGTAFNSWPAGSLLLIRGSFKEFRLRPLEGAPSLKSTNLVVLDGQQRLTALYTALRDSGDSVYAIDFSHLDAEHDDDIGLDERIRVFKRAVWDRKLSGPKAQLAAHLLPVSALLTPATFFDWRDQLLVHVASSEEAGHLKASLTQFYKDRLSAIHRYSIPVVFLDSTLSVAAIAKIFEKVNRSGLQLGTFDLMVARVYQPGFNLREEWESARIEHPAIDAFLDDGMAVLQAISLTRHLDVRQRAILEMRDEVQEEWPAAVEATRHGIDFLTGRCGVLRREWLPYGVELTCLAALGMGDDGLPAPEALEQWFWSRSFGKAFDVAANTRIVADFQKLRSGALIMERATVSAEALLSATRRGQRALWGAFLSALASRGTQDLLAGDDSEYESKGPVVASVLSRDVDVLYGQPPPHLRVLGLALMSHQTAAAIRRLGLAGAVAYFRSKHSTAVVDERLAQQWLPPSAEIVDGGMDGFELLEWRLDELSKWLRRWNVGIERE